MSLPSLCLVHPREFAASVMAGLVPAIHESGCAMIRHSVMNFTMQGGWVYIMTNPPNGTLYTGVTNDLARPVWEHREGVAEGVTKRYRLA